MPTTTTTSWSRTRAGLTVGNLASGRTWKLREQKATRWRVRPNAAGDQVVAYRHRTWRTVRVIKGDVELAAGGKPLTLRTPDGPVRYRGTLRSVDRGGERVTVNVATMEQYVRGVVAAELSSIWPQHALRAQAVAARTYAAYEREHTADTAAAKTAGRILTLQGETAFAEYSRATAAGRSTVAGPKGPHRTTPV